MQACYSFYKLLKLKTMNLQEKYKSVLDLGKQLNVQNGNVVEEGGVLKVWGTTKDQYDKDRLWDEIKSSRWQ